MSEIRLLVLSTMYPQPTNTVSGIFIHKQVLSLKKAGCNVRVVCAIPYAPGLLWFKKRWRDYGLTPLEDNLDGIRVYYPRYFSIPGKWFRSISAYFIYRGISKTIDRIIAEFKPNIIHSHMATPDGYTGLMLKRRYNIPLICSFRGGDINDYPWGNIFVCSQTKRVISEAEQNIAVSRALKKVAESLKKPQSDIRVIYNGCDSQDFKFDAKARSEVRSRLDISQDDKVIIFVGELFRDKGISELISSFIRLASERPDLHLMLVGDGPEHLNIRKRIGADGLIKRTHLLGGCSHNEIPGYLSASDIFVLPTHYEGLPNALLEAMSCGLPVVATRVGGIPEVVEDGKNGLLIDSRSPDNIYDSLKRLLDNNNLSKKMSRLNRQLIEERFSWTDHAKKIKEIYDSVL